MARDVIGSANSDNASAYNSVSYTVMSRKPIADNQS